MDTTTATRLSYRDRAVLRAIANGRATVSGSRGAALLIDGLCCSDQFAGMRLAEAGLIVLPGGAGSAPAQLTPTGQAVLQAA
jgi:hypothetical protein